MSYSTLETITGNLHSHTLLKPGTMRHVDQLTQERLTNTALCSHFFYTADGLIYLVNPKERNHPYLAITREQNNLLLNSLTSPSSQLSISNYQYTYSEASKSFIAPDTCIIDLTKLNLLGQEDEWRYLTIDTKDYHLLNHEQRKLAERIFGQGRNFDNTMNYFFKSKIYTTKIYVLNPQYVQEYTQKQPILRAAWLCNFGCNSNFNAVDMDINYPSNIRGEYNPSFLINRTTTSRHSLPDRRLLAPSQSVSIHIFSAQ